MFTVNRQVIILKPKEPFFEWLKSNNKFQELSLDDVNDDATVFLIPEFASSMDCEQYVKSVFPDLFDMVLTEWNLDETVWPTDRNYNLFKEWFDVSYYSTLIDTSEKELTKEFLH